MRVVSRHRQSLRLDYRFRVFKPRDQREFAAYDYVDTLRDEIAAVVDEHFPGGTVVLAAETGKPEAGDLVQFEIIGNEMQVLREISKQVQVALQQVPGAVDVRDNLGLPINEHANVTQR